MIITTKRNKQHVTTWIEIYQLQPYEKCDFFVLAVKEIPCFLRGPLK